MKRPWSLLICSFGCFVLYYVLKSYINAEEFVELYLRLLNMTILSAGFLSLSGFIFKAKPAAAASGVLLSLLAGYEAEAWYFVIPLAFLAFHGWSAMHKAEIKMMAQRAAGCGQNNMEQYEDNEQDKTDHSHEKPKMPPLFVNTEGQKPALEDVKPIRASDMDEKKAVALPVKQSIFDKMSDWWFFMDTGMKAFLIFAGVMIVVVLLIFLV